MDLSCPIHVNWFGYRFGENLVLVKFGRRFCHNKNDEYVYGKFYFHFHCDKNWQFCKSTYYVIIELIFIWFFFLFSFLNFSDPKYVLTSITCLDFLFNIISIQWLIWNHFEKESLCLYSMWSLIKFAKSNMRILQRKFVEISFPILNIQILFWYVSCKFAINFVATKLIDFGEVHFSRDFDWIWDLISCFFHF